MKMPLSSAMKTQLWSIPIGAVFVWFFIISIINDQAPVRVRVSAAGILIVVWVVAMGAIAGLDWRNEVRRSAEREELQARIRSGDMNEFRFRQYKDARAIKDFFRALGFEATMEQELGDGAGDYLVHTTATNKAVDATINLIGLIKKVVHES
jgi:hypothetical protein